MQYEEKDIITFSYNWNRKLDCKYFSTIRLHNRDKYQPGKELAVEYRDMMKPHPVRVIDRKTFLLKDMSDWMAYLDTGYPADKAREMLETMYKKKRINLDQARFDYVLLGWLWDKSAHRQLSLNDSTKF